MADDKVVTQEPAGEDAAQVKARLAELENLVAQKDTELAAANARLSEMEQAVAKSDRMLAQAVTSYRTAVVKANLGIPEELVTGGTVEEVDASVVTATALVNKVKQGLAAEMATTRVPTAAPIKEPAAVVRAVMVASRKMPNSGPVMKLITLG